MSTALILVDVDHFKQINDTYGHPAGDRVIQEVASQLRRVTRGEDLVARLGGDEFAVLISGCTSTAATARAAGCVGDDHRQPGAALQRRDPTVGQHRRRRARHRHL